MSRLVQVATSASWYAAATLVLAACASGGGDKHESPPDLKPFRDFATFTVSADRGTLVGYGNVKWLGRIDEIVAWRVPGFAEVFRQQIRLDDLASPGRQTRSAISISSDGRFLAYNAELTSLVVRDLHQGGSDRHFSFAPHWVWHLQFRDGGRQLLVVLGAQDQPDAPAHELELAIVDVESGRERRTPLGQEYRWLASRSHAARAAFRAERPWEGVANVTLSKSGDRLAMFRIPEAELSGRVEIWDIDAWEPLLEADFAHGLGTLVFSDDGGRLAIVTTAAAGAGDSNVLRVIDVSSAETIFETQSVGAPNHSYAAAFSPDGDQLATGTRCHGVQLWDLQARARIAHANFGGCLAADRITGIAYSKDGRGLYLMSVGGELRAVDIDRFGNPP